MGITTPAHSSSTFWLIGGRPTHRPASRIVEGCVESMWDFAGPAAAPSWARNVTGQNGAVNPSAAECRMAHRLYLHGIGCLVFDGTCWRPGRGVDVFRRPSFDGENLGRRGCDPPRANGGRGRRGVGDFINMCVEPATGRRVRSVTSLAAVNEAHQQAGGALYAHSAGGLPATSFTGPDMPDGSPASPRVRRVALR